MQGNTEEPNEENEEDGHQESAFRTVSEQEIPHHPQEGVEQEENGEMLFETGSARSHSRQLSFFFGGYFRDVVILFCHSRLI